jgi:hypothetical protein
MILHVIQKQVKVPPYHWVSPGICYGAMDNPDVSWVGLVNTVR